MIIERECVLKTPGSNSVEPRLVSPENFSTFLFLPLRRTPKLDFRPCHGIAPTLQAHACHWHPNSYHRSWFVVSSCRQTPDFHPCYGNTSFPGFRSIFSPLYPDSSSFPCSGSEQLTLYWTNRQFPGGNLRLLSSSNPGASEIPDRYFPDTIWSSYIATFPLALSAWKHHQLPRFEHLIKVFYVEKRPQIKELSSWTPTVSRLESSYVKPFQLSMLITCLKQPASPSEKTKSINNCAIENKIKHHTFLHFEWFR